MTGVEHMHVVSLAYVNTDVSNGLLPWQLHETCSVCLGVQDCSQAVLCVS